MTDSSVSSYTLETFTEVNFDSKWAEGVDVNGLLSLCVYCASFLSAHFSWDGLLEKA